MKKIIVTGGSGFLGTNLIIELKKQGYEILNIDLKQNKFVDVETVILDIRDKEKIKQIIKDACCVFHLAALIQAGESVQKPQLYIDTNIQGTLNVLEAMRLNNIKNIIFSSSAAVYGEPLSIPIKEDDRTMPINPYGVTKLTIEGMLSSYVKNFGFNAISFRYFNLYGPYEHHEPETHAIPRFIKQIYNDEPITIWGDGKYVRDFIYIKDLVKAHIMAIDFLNKNKGVYHYFNLASESGISIIDLAKKIAKFIGKTPNLKFFDPRPGDPRVLQADSTKVKQQMGWVAETNLDTGLRKTIDYFLNIWENS